MKMADSAREVAPGASDESGRDESQVASLARTLTELKVMKGVSRHLRECFTFHSSRKVIGRILG